jgi:integrase
MQPPRKLERKHGHVWEVRWREGGRHRSRAFPFRQDAELFKTELWRARRLGPLADLVVADQSLPEFCGWWWRVHVNANLAPSTRRRYEQVLHRHLLPHLGELRVREITPPVVAEFRADLAERGVPNPTARKVLFVLQSIMRLAVLRGAIAHNPVKAIPKPPQESRTVSPPRLSEVEAIRSRLGLRDATLVSLLAYAGLRPGEALALRWRDVGDRSIVVERSVSLGRERPTKTRATCAVGLLAPLAHDLAAYWEARNQPARSTLLFRRPDGGPWSDDDYRNWRSRNFAPAVVAARLEDVRPYDLRHFFVSLLIDAGAPILDVAYQAGHSPDECLRTYAHVFAGASSSGGSTPLTDIMGRWWIRAGSRIGAARAEPPVSESGCVAADRRA